MEGLLFRFRHFDVFLYTGWDNATTSGYISGYPGKKKVASEDLVSYG